MANISPLQDIYNSFLCPICFEQLKEPKLMPCLHRYCRDCVDAIIRVSHDNFRCPQCREEIRIPPNGVDGFKTDFYSKSLVEYVQIQQSLESDKVRECYSCSKHLRVSAYCFKCSAFLCKDCYDFHVRNKTLKDHQKHTLSMEDSESKNLTIERLTSMRDAPRCHIHPEKILRLCCETCGDLPVCVACVYGLHKGHNLHEVEALAKLKRGDLSQKLKTLEIVKKDKTLFDGRQTQEKLTLKVNIEKEKLTKIHDEKVQEIMTKIQDTEQRQEQAKTEKQNTEKQMSQSLQEEMEKEIAGIKKKYEEIIKVKKYEISATFEAKERSLIEELTNLYEKLESFDRDKKQLLESIEKQHNENAKIIERISKHFDNIGRRFETLNVMASSILTSENDWLAVQCIPDICTAASNLLEDLKKDFPELKSLTDVTVNYNQSSLGEKGIINISEQVEMELKIDNTDHYFHGITSSGDGNITISGSPLKEFQPSLEVEATVNQIGGLFEIPKTGVILVVPPNALPEDLEQCKIQMRIICHPLDEDQEASFSTNSSTTVELLPNKLTFRHPVRLMLPHCLVLGGIEDRSARIFVSHHIAGHSPQWEEQTHLPYYLEDTTCTILLDSFCWVKYSVNDKIVTAKKIVVFAAAKKLHHQDDAATVVVGCHNDLPGKLCEFLQRNPGVIVSQKKTFFFRKSERCYPLQFSLNEVFPSEWQGPEETRKEAFYETIAARSKECAFVYIIKKKEKTANTPLCVFTASQEKGQMPVNLVAYPQTSSRTSPSCGAHIHLPQDQTFLATGLHVNQDGGTYEIPDTGVVLKVPQGAFPANKQQCVIHMRIIPSRKIQDEVISFSSNSSVAVEIISDNLQLEHPLELKLPHCLELQENAEKSVRIFTKDHNEVSRSEWEEQTNLKYRLDDSACIIWMERLGCIKYAVDDKIVTGKKIVMYTAARRDIQKFKEIADVEVGYYSDMPGGGELLRLNPNLLIDFRNVLYFKEKQNCPLKLTLDNITPSKWVCRFPEQKLQAIPFSMVACSIEHSYLYVLQNMDKKVGNAVCEFTAFQEDVDIPVDLVAKAFPEDDQPNMTETNPQRTAGGDSMTEAFQYLSDNLDQEWPDVGRRLGLSDAKLKQIKADHSNSIHHAIDQMLIAWKQSHGSIATYNSLVNALKRSGRTDLAEDIESGKHQPRRI